MSRKLTIQMLAERFAARTGVAQSEAEDFIKAYFATVETALVGGDSVEIDTLGRFSVEHGEVMFSPATTVAATINEPFAFFKPVPVNNDITEDVLAGAISNCDSISTEPDTIPESAPEHDTEPEKEPDSDVDTDENTVYELPAEHDDTTESMPVGDSISSDEDETSVRFVGNGLHRRHIVWAMAGGIIAGLLIGWGMACWQYGLNPFNHAETKLSIPASEPEAETSEVSRIVVDTVPEDTDGTPMPASTITDTVKVGYYFTTMAKKYYGNKNFWGYIYKENESRLSHPEHTAPGTVVVIPPASKYGIDADNPESVKAAKALDYEIYSRYQ